MMYRGSLGARQWQHAIIDPFVGLRLGLRPPSASRPPCPGVRLRGGRTIRATHAVVSNASAPDTLRLLPREAVPDSWRASVAATPLNPSFMHLHLGFDATGEAPSAVHLATAALRVYATGSVPLHAFCCGAGNCIAFSSLKATSRALSFNPAGLEGLELHHIVVNDWERGVDAQQNVVLVSIASGEGQGWQAGGSAAPRDCHPLPPD